MSNRPEYRAYLAWDAPTRWFHWINAISVIGLIATGLVVLNGDVFGLSAEGKVALKSVHISFGYVMTMIFCGALFGPSSATDMRDGGPSYRAALVSWRLCRPTLRHFFPVSPSNILGITLWRGLA